MDALSSCVPWNTPETWMEANDSLAASIARHRAGMSDLSVQAHQIHQRLEALFPLMDALCRETCPNCPDVCCLRAWVWADFRDLLFYHLSGIAPPEHQLLASTGDHCRFAGPHGCHLERIRRPFVCTWYLCPAQTRLLYRQPAEQHNLLRDLKQIKNDRKRMEISFIRAIV